VCVPITAFSGATPGPGIPCICSKIAGEGTRRSRTAGPTGGPGGPIIRGEGEARLDVGREVGPCTNCV